MGLEADPEQCLALMKDQCGDLEHGGDVCRDCVRSKVGHNELCQGTGSGKIFCTPTLEGDPEQCLALMKDQCGDLEHGGDVCRDCIRSKIGGNELCQGTGSGNIFCTPTLEGDPEQCLALMKDQ